MGLLIHFNYRDGAGSRYRGGTAMPPTIEPREALIWFSKKMEVVLRRNDMRKGTVGWRSSSHRYVIDRIVKLANRLDSEDLSNQELQEVSILLAGYCMMLADNTREKRPNGA